MVENYLKKKGFAEKKQRKAARHEYINHQESNPRKIKIGLFYRQLLLIFK
jgi:hypothetical protein